VSDEVAKLLLKSLADDRPVVLFLGQNAWRSAEQNDPILEALVERVVPSASGPISSWRQLIETATLKDEDYSWLTERFERNVQPESLQDVFDLAWSAVFTTSIDPRVSRRFETRGRQPEAVLAGDHYAKSPRSKYRPPIYHVFGRANESSPPTKAPRSRLELRQRIATHGNAILNRIGETVTPLGLLVVEGLQGDGDWLRVDDLLAPLAESKCTKVLWFGASEVPGSEFFAELVQKELVVPCAERLTDVVAELRARGLLDSFAFPKLDEPGVVSIDNGSMLVIPPSLRLRVEASAAIVDDSWTAKQVPLTGLALQEDFRRFHGDLGGIRNLVEGIGSGYAIERDFEAELRQKVEAALKDQRGEGRTVIVHGQSGTGKSVAIARLARMLRLGAKLPVLYSIGRVPAVTDVDEFCGEVERLGSQGTVLLCDTNQTATRYQDLADSLQSRGRRIAIVGTTYRLEDPRGRGTTQYVEAKAEFSAQERAAVRDLVKAFVGESAAVEKYFATDTNALALLYRTLSPSRERIISGISGEARATEEHIRTRAKSVPVTQTRSALAAALIAAGLHDSSPSAFDDAPDTSGSGSDAPGRLIDYVMVAGRLNCAIPVNLLMRALQSKIANLDVGQLAYLFNELDLFRWRLADAEGDEYLVSPRLQLEAELICRRRLADKERELDRLIELIESVRPSSVDRSAEMQFLLDLLHKLDRDGPRSTEYADGYLRVARALTNLRVKLGVKDASLMLQESAFRRAALWWHDRGPAFNTVQLDEHRYEILDEARSVVEEAIREINEGRLHAGKRTRANLQVERASIYGYLAVGRAMQQAAAEEVWADYSAARVAITRAIASAGGYIPLDIGLWTPVDIIRAHVLPPEKHAEIRADIYSVLDQVDVGQMPPGQYQRYQERRLKVAQTLTDEALSEDAYRKLEEVNAPAAYFLKARGMCTDVLEELEGPYSDSARERVAMAVQFLRARYAKISNDARCVEFLLQLEWILATGYRLLRGERRPVPKDPATSLHLHSLVTDLVAAAGETIRYPIRYLSAVLSWLRGDISYAGSTWQELARETEFEDPTRVIRRLYVADPAGRPLLYRGTVDSKRSEGHWRVRLEGAPGKIDLLERDFRIDEIRIGRELRNVVIAFNYLGPVADPVSRYSGRP
jgi:hypothetical protein